jgi:hypothetical protein
MKNIERDEKLPVEDRPVEVFLTIYRREREIKLAAASKRLVDLGTF